MFKSVFWFMLNVWIDVCFDLCFKVCFDLCFDVWFDLCFDVWFDVCLHVGPAANDQKISFEGRTVMWY